MFFSKILAAVLVAFLGIFSHPASAADESTNAIADKWSLQVGLSQQEEMGTQITVVAPAWFATEGNWSGTRFGLFLGNKDYDELEGDSLHPVTNLQYGISVQQTMRVAQLLNYMTRIDLGAAQYRHHSDDLDVEFTNNKTSRYGFLDIFFALELYNFFSEQAKKAGASGTVMSTAIGVGFRQNFTNQNKFRSAGDKEVPNARIYPGIQIGVNF